MQETFSQTLRRNGENLTQAAYDSVNRLKQQLQLQKDLKRETFHRNLVEALHYPELFKKARWQ